MHLGEAKGVSPALVARTSVRNSASGVEDATGGCRARHPAAWGPVEQTEVRATEHKLPTRGGVTITDLYTFVHASIGHREMAHGVGPDGPFGACSGRARGRRIMVHTP